MDLRQIEVKEILHPGQTASLRIMTVRNPGDEPGAYQASAGGIEDDEFLEPLDSWFRLEPRTFRLDPQATQRVAVSLVVPDSAPPGNYLRLLRFELVAEGAGSLVGAAAGVAIRFTVADASGMDSLLRAMAALIEANRPWSLLLPIALLAIGVGLWASRRFRLRIETR